LKELTVGMRLLQEIKVVEPADGATFDLQRNLLRWTAVPGAASYRIQLGYKEDTLQQSTLYGGGAITVSSPSVCLGALPASQTQGWIRTALTPGRTGIWHVDAFDRNGRKVGAMVETNHSFLVARGLESR